MKKVILAILIFLTGCMNQEQIINNQSLFTRDSLIKDVIGDSVMDDFAQYIFPLNRSYYSGKTLNDLSLTWYSNIDPNKTVEIVNYFKEKTMDGKTVFYDIYSDEEKEIDPSKENTGLFFFKGNKGAPFAICNAGGGFAYVGAIHDSFPHALEISKQGYNAFALIYRPDATLACMDLSRAIDFVFEHADELEVNVNNYSLWGGSAGARMVGWVSSLGTNYFIQKEHPKPSAVIMQYSGHSEASVNDVATYSNVGMNDPIANYRGMQNRIEKLKQLGIDTEFHAYPGLTHGFGIGTNTVSEGWVNQAIAFWQRQGGKDE